MPSKKKWTVKSVTSNIMMVTGAVTAITGALKQVMDLAGCQVRKLAFRTLESMPRDYVPPPPPPPSKWEIFKYTVYPYHWVAVIAIGIVLVLIARKLRNQA